MQMYEYQLEATKTCQTRADLLYLTGKLVVEAAELSQHVLKAQYHDKEVSVDALVDEAGDVLWYLANICDQLGVSLEYVASCNVTKLRARHGEQYNPAHYAPGKTRTAAELVGLVLGSNSLE